CSRVNLIVEATEVIVGDEYRGAIPVRAFFYLADELTCPVVAGGHTLLIVTGTEEGMVTARRDDREAWKVAARRGRGKLTIGNQILVLGGIETFGEGGTDVPQPIRALPFDGSVDLPGQPGAIQPIHDGRYVLHRGGLERSPVGQAQ